jgi:hypothetical protein
MEADHDFTLILDGIPDLSREVVDALFEAGCDDGTLSSSAGVVSMDFTRSAPSMKEAIISAIRDVRKANIGARVVRVEGSEGASTEALDGEVLRLIGA